LQSFFDWKWLESLKRYGDLDVTSGKKKMQYLFNSEKYVMGILCEIVLAIELTASPNANADKVFLTNHTFKNYNIANLISQIMVNMGKTVKDHFIDSANIEVISDLYTPKQLDSNAYYSYKDINQEMSVGDIFYIPLYVVLPISMIPNKRYKFSIDFSTFNLATFLNTITNYIFSLNNVTFEPFLLETSIPIPESHIITTQEDLTYGTNFMKKLPEGLLNKLIIHGVDDVDFASPFDNIQFIDQDGELMYSIASRVADILAYTSNTEKVLITSSGADNTYAHTTVKGHYCPDNYKLFNLPDNFILKGDNKISFQYLGSSDTAKIIIISYPLVASSATGSKPGVTFNPNILSGKASFTAGFNAKVDAKGSAYTGANATLGNRGI
jgi:hypothetical protein